jgi:hypothetical protein
MKKQLFKGSGLLLRVFGFLLMGIGMLGGSMSMSLINNFILPTSDTPRQLSSLVLGLAGVGIFIYILLLSGRFLFKRGRQLSLKGQEDEIQQQVARIVQGNMPAVLYLRSFHEDDSADSLSDVDRNWLPYGQMLASTQSTEEQLTELFEPVAPMICIGDPREGLPTVGALRIYYREDTERWRQEVIAMMRRARLVIIRAGQTLGLEWELQQALAELPPEKLVCLVIERKNADFSQFEAQLDQMIEGKTGKPVDIYLPAPPLSRWQRLLRQLYVAPHTAYGKVISFTPDWEPVITPILNPGYRWFWRTRMGKRLYTALWVALQPALKNAGLVLPQPPLGWGTIISAILLSLMLLLYGWLEWLA